MTVTFESGYTLPSGDLPLNHARVLHDGNRLKVKTVTASNELALYPGSAANSGDTVDRWRPFENEVLDPSDFSTANWIRTNVTVASDGKTAAETTALAAHAIQQTYTFTNVETVFSIIIERQSLTEINLRTNDGSNSYTRFFDLRDLTVGTGVGTTGKIIDLGDGRIMLRTTFTPAAGTGFAQILFSNGSETTTYTGSTSNTVKILQAVVHPSEATLTYDLFTAQEGDTFAIAAHNLWSSGATLKPQYLGADVTNLLTHSEQFDNAAWTKINTVIAANTSTAPDGAITAEKLTSNNATGGYLTLNTASGASSGTSYTGSVYLKAAELNHAFVTYSGSSGVAGGASVNLLTGVVSQAVAGYDAIGVEDAGSGWFRVSITDTTTSAGAITLNIYLSNDGVWANRNASIAIGEGVFIWGAQLQSGTEATSYIKTEATAVTSGWRDFNTWLSFSDNSPVMFIYEPITSDKWRIQISGGALPEIGVFRVGKSLQMERPFYGGFTIPRMARNAVVRGNISGSGELLGRSLERTTLNTSYQWQHLSYAWVRANLDGPSGLIQSAETEPLFLAWRPSETQDVDYVMRASTEPPNAMGLRDLWTFGMSGEAYSYE